MKPVVLTSAILSFAAVVYSSEVSASSIPYSASNGATKQNINMIEGDKRSLSIKALRHISVSSRCSHDANTNYQLTSGDFLIYFLFLLICLILLFQLWLDFNLPRPKKDY